MVIGLVNAGVMTLMQAKKEIDYMMSHKDISFSPRALEGIMNMCDIIFDFSCMGTLFSKILF